MKELRRKFLIPESRVGRLQVMSSGGGTQSSCMIVLAYQGLIPKPDIIVMADTEREASNVFTYQHDYIKPLCDEMGIDYVFIKKSEFTTADILFNKDPDSVLPGFFTERDGRDRNNLCNKKPGFCSDKWKRVPIQRYLNNRYGERELTKRGVDTWIGMSFDEIKRVKYPSGKWQKRYPLFEAQIVREQAIKIVEESGLPTPPRSACWMCPNRHDDEWQWMKDMQPEDFEAAIVFEEEIQAIWPYYWLHKSGTPIGEVDFIASSKSDKQQDIFHKHCDTGMCFV